MGRSKSQEITDTLLEAIPAIAMTCIMTKLAAKLYHDNPSMFWSYMQHKHNDIIFNCRM